ncbi:hypothetical protein BJ875DRAFT_498489 [Amylocarpus encephaloides]|uniref:Translation initiation factor 3 N-terminal domain-containing protein n=1 Tax=Amylocarpus encephaloides TaxID=45428 RepID=A0A9P8C2C9_9HELO|nr:hypothetical protein BJ875DRAFT_498489 [Amylocarpus encephaloides]
MRTSKHVFNSAAALRNVFVPAIESRPIQLRMSPLTSQWRPNPILPIAQRRSYNDTSAKVPTARYPRDSEITARHIILVNDDGNLGAPILTTRVRASMDPLNTESLIMVAEPTESIPYPICKVINKAKEYARMKALKKARKENKDPAKTCKTLEIGWGIEKGDERHRMERLRGFLAKGYRVEVVVAKKRRGRSVGGDEMRGLLGRVRGCIEDGGWKEGKEMEGNVGEKLTIFAEGKVPKGKENGDGKGMEEGENNEEVKVKAGAV